MRTILYSLAAFLTFIPVAVFAGDNNLVNLPIGETGDFNDYINAVYLMFISIAALIAVVKIIIAGVKYMFSDIVTQKSDAKRDIQGALLGLLVVLAAVVVLTIINPDLTTFDPDITRTEMRQPIAGNSDSPANRMNQIMQNNPDTSFESCLNSCVERNGRTCDLATCQDEIATCESKNGTAEEIIENRSMACIYDSETFPCSEETVNINTGRNGAERTSTTNVLNCDNAITTCTTAGLTPQYQREEVRVAGIVIREAVLRTRDGGLVCRNTRSGNSNPNTTNGSTASEPDNQNTSESSNDSNGTTGSASRVNNR